MLPNIFVIIKLLRRSLYDSFTKEGQIFYGLTSFHTTLPWGKQNLIDSLNTALTAQASPHIMALLKCGKYYKCDCFIIR